MSLLNDLKAYYAESNYPPDGPDLDQYLDEDTGKWTAGDTVTELVDEKDLDEARWGTWFQNVYKRGDELVAVRDCRPATEYQDWGDYGSPEIYPVTAHTEVVTITKYKKV